MAHSLATAARDTLPAWLARALGRPVSRLPAFHATRAPIQHATATNAPPCPVSAVVRDAVQSVEGAFNRGVRL